MILETYVNGVTYISEGRHLEIAEHYLSLALVGHPDSFGLVNPCGSHTVIIHCGPNPMSQPLSSELAGAMLRGLNLPADSFKDLKGRFSDVKEE